MVRGSRRMEYGMHRPSETRATGQGRATCTYEPEGDRLKLLRIDHIQFVRGSVRVHLGVESVFAPARKAHPAFVVDGRSRVFLHDPFGNRIELIDGSGAV